MMRKLLTIIQITILGLFAAGGMAGAAQAAAPYEPTGGVTINIIINGNVTIINGNVTIIVGNIYVFTGSGFDPFEGINVSTSVVPSGLRSSAGLSQLAAANKLATSADGAGNFTTSLLLSQIGETTITATGQSSGKSASFTVFVLGAGANGGASADAVAAGNGSNASGGGGANAAGSGSNAESTGLAYTGASIAGPLAIGLVALLAGLTLLFFGTRGVRRRKHAQASQ